MDYPLINISQKYWVFEDMMEYILYDDFICTTDQSYHHQYLLNKKFCDSKGEIYQLIELEFPKSGWRKALKFLPNTYKITFKFHKTGEHISVAELQNHLLEKAAQLKDSDFKTEYISSLQKGTTHFQLISGDVH